MKFLAKRTDSRVLSTGQQYKANGDNSKLLRLLLCEQQGFCAYTEKRISALDTCAVEHLVARFKGTDADGYRNWYGVLQSANQRKRRKEARYAGSLFFESRFFQQEGGFAKRIVYLVEDHLYASLREDDQEAQDFINYLGLNDPELVAERRNHVERLLELFAAAGVECLSTDRISSEASHGAELSHRIDTRSREFRPTTRNNQRVL